ncbi:hypothetical protein RCG23_23535 [Neobacillus sp. PS3-34]|uniref:hypothetical protein n=1 Tax=Neobacillus sp. PS3-34 TaxID=3070678 RepID=UPI0027E0A2A0|nr:hypothetical protein [Neobacillus sp. PS3-34]WML48198.1 hypothetical protein RCG23_23535 [Neobacillus sp. PS3-34]
MAVSTLELKSFLLNHAGDMTNQWLSLRKKEEEKSVYSNQMPNRYVKEIKSRNLKLIKSIAENIGNGKDIDLESWGETVGKTRAKYESPIYRSMEQFKLFREIFWEYFSKFIEYWRFNRRYNGCTGII